MRQPLRISLGLLGLLAAWPAGASQVRSINLEQMTARAARVFAGRCTAVEVRPDPVLGHDVATVRFDVERVVKGAPGSTLTVRMLAGGADDAGSRSSGRLPFAPGEEVVLFLYGESELGLTSPVGMGQGRFSIVTDKEGRRVAINSLANRNLLEGLTEPGRQRLGSRLATWRGRADLDRDALLEMAEALKAP